MTSLEHVSTLTGDPRCPEPSAVSLTAAGEAVVLWTDAPRSSSAVISVYEKKGRADVPIDSASAASSHVAALPEGRVLVVGSRAEWRDGKAEQNATLYDSDGSVVLTACVGDGVQHVRASDRGSIWIGYSDEGIFGSAGRGEPGPDPIGAAGPTTTQPSTSSG